MFRILLSFLRRSRPDSKRIGIKGFVYTPDKEPGPLTNAKAGDVVSVANSPPPWIVVDHGKDSIVFTNWPGSLWLVEIVEPAPSSEQITNIYSRAGVVRLIEISSATELFGPHGEAVEAILNQASELQIVDIDRARSPQRTAGDVYSRAWTNWLGQNDLSSEYLGADHSHTLGVGSPAADSPIGCGFGLLFNVMHKRARELEGDAAFIVDDEGEIFFTDKWNTAFNLVRHAAMASGAPELLSDAERDVLIAGWNQWLSSE